MKLKEGATKRAAAVKMIVFDVDGVLSDGRLYYGPQGEIFKAFFTRDGLGISLARQVGIKLAIITGRSSKIVMTRAQELGFDAIYQGKLQKKEAYEQLKADFGFLDEQMAYIGDDIIDLPVLECAGFSAAVGDAVPEVAEAADIVSDFPGGSGAVRQIIEFILKAQGKWQEIVEAYKSGNNLETPRAIQ